MTWQSLSTLSLSKNRGSSQKPLTRSPHRNGIPINRGERYDRLVLQHRSFERRADGRAASNAGRMELLREPLSTRDLFHVKEIPLAPRRGVLNITTDPEVIHYYLCFADAYSEEARKHGWDSVRYTTASEGLIAKLEAASGLVRGYSTGLAIKLGS